MQLNAQTFNGKQQFEHSIKLDNLKDTLNFLSTLKKYCINAKESGVLGDFKLDDDEEEEDSRYNTAEIAPDSPRKSNEPAKKKKRRV